ncbi:DUF2513 domain-containing protein [Calothrix sp. FACHB-156]|nr:DUF2513 domain-containing protein [Calothrix sp. FACHB-156]
MHNNLKLIKAILEAIEQSDNPVKSTFNFYDNFSFEEIQYNLNLLHSTDFIELVHSTSEKVSGFTGYCLTYHGVELLNNLSSYK